MDNQPLEQNAVTNTITNEKTDRNGRVLVTGGTGLVGSHLLELLVNEGYQVNALSRTKKPSVRQHENVQWVETDILDVIALDKAFYGIDYVYHCAAMVSFNAAKKHELFQTNIEGTANVVNAALNAGVKKLCYVSSVAALGKSIDGNITNEKMAWNEETNSSNYGKSKQLAEVEVWRGIAEGLQAVIVNPSIILGSGDWNEGSTKIFKTAYDEFPYFTEGVTGFVDVKDVAKAMVELMQSDVTGERFIVSSENRKYKEIFTLAAEAFERKAPYKKVGALMANIVWRALALKAAFSDQEPLLTKETANAAQSIVLFDNSKLKKFLPSFSYTSLEETIERVCKELKEKNGLATKN